MRTEADSSNFVDLVVVLESLGIVMHPQLLSAVKISNSNPVTLHLQRASEHGILVLIDFFDIGVVRYCDNLEFRAIGASSLIVVAVFASAVSQAWSSWNLRVITEYSPSLER